MVDDRVARVPRPPLQLRAEVVEDLVEHLAGEGDGDRTGERPAAAEDPERPHDLVGELADHRVERDDVERQPVRHELHGELVVGEDEAVLLVEAEPLREVQRRLRHEEVDQRSPPQRQVDRITRAVPAKGVHQREDRAADDQHLEQRHRPVGECPRRTDRDHRGDVVAVEAEAAGDGFRLRSARDAHQRGGRRVVRRRRLGLGIEPEGHPVLSQRRADAVTHEPGEHPRVPQHLPQRLVEVEHLREVLVDHFVFAGGADDEAERRAGHGVEDTALPFGRLLGALGARVTLVAGHRQAPRHGEELALRAEEPGDKTRVQPLGAGEVLAQQQRRPGRGTDALRVERVERADRVADEHQARRRGAQAVVAPPLVAGRAGQVHLGRRRAAVHRVGEQRGPHPAGRLDERVGRARHGQAPRTHARDDAVAFDREEVDQELVLGGVRALVRRRHDHQVLPPPGRGPRRGSGQVVPA